MQWCSNFNLCCHLSGSLSGKLGFILVEKGFDELVDLYAKVFCTNLWPSLSLFSFFFFLVPLATFVNIIHIYIRFCCISLSPKLKEII